MTNSNYNLERLEKCAGEQCRRNVQAAYDAFPVEDINNSLEEKVYCMSDAIINDPVKPIKTPDLGTSQLYRLNRFFNYFQNQENKEMSDLPDYLKELDKLGIPVIGAEFHLPKKQKTNALEKEIFILNMAQYQTDSSIPLSKKEDDLIEIRIN